MRWAIHRGGEGGAVLVGHVEGTTLEDAVRLAKALGMVKDDGAPYGIEHLGPRDDDARPVGKLSVVELATMLGITDLIAARQHTREEHQKAAQSMKAAEQLVRDIAGLQSVNARERLACAHDVDVFAESVKRSLSDAPGHVLVLLLAWVDERGTTYTSKPRVVN